MGWRLVVSLREFHLGVSFVAQAQAPDVVVAAPPADLEEIEGPTPEFQGHHDVVDRSGGVPGKRVRTKLEHLLTTGYISADQASAGRRFQIDYLKGCVGKSKSCLDIVISGGNGYQSEERHDAAASFEKARAVLDGSRIPQALGISPSQALLYCCVEEWSFAALGALLGVTDSIAKARVAMLLAVLTVHYESVDRTAGRSSTVQTAEGIQRLFDPDLPAPNSGQPKDGR